MLAGGAVVHLHVARLDHEPTPVGHGVTRVHHQVQDDLLHLRGIGLRPARPGGRLRDQLDLLADEPSEHRRHPRHHRVQVQHLRLEGLAPAEDQELPRERPRAIGGRLDELDVVTEGMVGPQVMQEDVAPPGDHHEEVVEVVRHPRRQLPDRLDLL